MPFLHENTKFAGFLNRERYSGSRETRETRLFSRLAGISFLIRNPGNLDFRGLDRIGCIKYTFVMERTTLSIKVSRSFASQFREFCDANALSIGKFAEQQLGEIMEDYHFGSKAQRFLSSGDTRRKGFKDLLKRG